MSGCATRTTTHCTACSTTSAARSTCTPISTRPVTPAVTLLGPQRRPTLDRVVQALGIDGPVVAVNAGWQDRETDDAELLSLLGGRGANLLLHVLRLFDVSATLPPRVIAWSAGAMAITERVVLFHDRAAHGPAQTEVLDAGLGVVRGVVALPHARRRLRIEDALRMSILARRFAPAACLVLDDGVTVELGPEHVVPPDARLVLTDGKLGSVGER